MKNKILMRTNVLICTVILAGFLVTTVLSYQANYSASVESIEQVSTLTSEGIFYQLSALFSRPVNVSLTMATSRKAFGQRPEMPAKIISSRVISPSCPGS